MEKHLSSGFLVVQVILNDVKQNVIKKKNDGDIFYENCRHFYIMGR